MLEPQKLSNSYLKTWNYLLMAYVQFSILGNKSDDNCIINRKLVITFRFYKVGQQYMLFLFHFSHEMNTFACIIKNVKKKHKILESNRECETGLFYK
jgi:hypothetical protein